MRITGEDTHALSREQVQRLSNYCAHAGRNLFRVVEHFVQHWSQFFPEARNLIRIESVGERYELACALASIVKHISTPETCSEMMRPLAARLMRSGFEAGARHNLRPCLIDALRSCGGVEWTSQIERDWSDAIDLWLNCWFSQESGSATRPAHAPIRRAA